MRNRPPQNLPAALIAVLLAGCGVQQVDPPKDEWFQKNVTSQSELVLVDFGAEWCGPCQAMKPAIERLEEAHPDTLHVVPIDVDEHPELAAHYDVDGIPRLILFKQGKIIAAETGGMSYEELEAWARSYLD